MFVLNVFFYFYGFSWSLSSLSSFITLCEYTSWLWSFIFKFLLISQWTKRVRCLCRPVWYLLPRYLCVKYLVYIFYTVHINTCRNIILCAWHGQFVFITFLHEFRILYFDMLVFQQTLIGTSIRKVRSNIWNSNNNPLFLRDCIAVLVIYSCGYPLFCLFS